MAAYRRPDFRVDATLTSATPFAGTTLTGTVTARYLFGAPMKTAPVRWTYSRTAAYGAPSSLLRNFPLEGFDFGARPPSHGRTELRADEDPTDAEGSFEVELETTGGDGVRYDYQIEGEVTDVSRQRIANRASLSVHPAAVYVGVKLPYFVDQSAGVNATLVALTPEGAYVPDTDIAVTVQHVQWISTRRAEGSGFYTWDTEEKVTDVGTWHAKSGREPVTLPLPLKEGGYFKLRAEAKDAEGRLAVAETEFYALGPGYTAWTRYDHNRIDLVPERKQYAPGESARIMIKSPWEQATALVTTEREGVRTHKRFALTSSQQSISVPITEADIPNVFVSVLLVKGRSKDATPDDGSDPGKPSFRLGYLELKVEDASKRLTVTAKADKDEFRPANKAKVAVAVKDFAGKPAQSEVTLWAVDYGVLSLTAFQTPDVLKSVYVEKALQVITTDSRQRIVSRRVLTPKGGDEGGGGGEEPGSGTVRKDFRVLAFWVGSVVTDANGQASVDVTLPESLTTYRIMAVAADKASRFGSADSEIRVNKPLTMKPAFPRFLARGDKASFGAVVTSQLKTKGSATVTIKSLDPAILEITGETKRAAALAAGGAVEVKFDAVAKAIGKARIQMTARMGGESDAFEDVIPVEVLVSPETVAAYGDTTAEAREKVTLPAGVVAGFGGLSLELASTAMVGLGEGARYLIEYPYGCAEQRSSRALALLLAADLGDAFALPDINAKDARTISQAQITQLEQFQCPGGGFAYWPGQCNSVSPYLTAYVLHVFQVAGSLKYKVNAEVMERAYTYLEGELAQAQAGERELDSGLHGVAGVRREGARRRRAQPGFAHHAAQRLSRSHAGVRPHLPRRRDGGQGRGRPAPRRAAAAHEERRAARGRQRPRRGAERSVPALVLELERPLDGDRPESPGAAVDAGSRSAGHGALDARGAEERPLGQHAGERDGDGSARHLLSRPRSGDPGLHGRRELRRRQAAGAAGVQGPLRHGGDEDRADADAARQRSGRRVARPDVRQDRHRPPVLRGAVEVRGRRAAARGARQRLRDHAHVRADRGRRQGRDRAGDDVLQGGRPGPRHARVRPDEGAALRRGRRSAAGRLRARRILVRDHGAGSRRPERRSERAVRMVAALGEGRLRPRREARRPGAAVRDAPQ